MARIKNPLLSLKAIGKLGNITFRRSRKIDVAEKMPVVPDAKSPGQLAWRPMFLKCVDLWHTLSAAEKQIWESQARSRHMTGYAWYLSQCLRPNPGIYLPLVGGTMQGAIDMAGNKIEDLPDPIVAQEADTLVARNAAIATHGVGHITILPWNYSHIGQGAWGFADTPGSWARFTWRSAPPNDGDNISYNVFLAKGAYNLCILSANGTGSAIVDVDIDAVEVASFNLYAAAPTFNVRDFQANIVIATSGLKTLKLRVDGKDPLSTGFGCYFSAIALWRIEWF